MDSGGKVVMKVSKLSNFVCIINQVIPKSNIVTKPPHYFTDIDDCVSNQCMFNGTCVDGVADYTCDCVDGFRGKHCEESKYKYKFRLIKWSDYLLSS